MDISKHIINILSCIIAVEYIGHGLDKRYVGWRRWFCFAVGCAVYFSLITALNFFTNFEGILCVFYGAGLLLYAIWALRGNFYNKAFLSLMWILNILFSTFLVYGALGTFLGQGIPDIIGGADKKVIFYASLAAIVVKFVMGRVIIRLYRQREFSVGKEDWQIMGALFLVLLAGLNMFRLELNPTGDRGHYGRLTCLLICQFVGVLLLERLYQKLVEYRQQKLDSEFRDKLTRETARWRHDMDGKLEALYLLQKDSQYDEVTRLLKEMCKEFTEYPELTQPTCSNGLNTALIKALALCRNNGIHFSYAVLGKPDMLDDMDIESLMWNLLSNGIEACMQANQTRILDVVMCAKSDTLTIRLENTISDSVLHNNPQLHSSKADKFSHGFGMQTIYSILDKYQGCYLYQEEDCLFIQELRLQRPPQAPLTYKQKPT